MCLNPVQNCLNKKCIKQDRYRKHKSYVRLKAVEHGCVFNITERWRATWQGESSSAGPHSSAQADFADNKEKWNRESYQLGMCCCNPRLHEHTATCIAVFNRIQNTIRGLFSFLIFQITLGPTTEEESHKLDKSLLSNRYCFHCIFVHCQMRNEPSTWPWGTTFCQKHVKIIVRRKKFRFPFLVPHASFVWMMLQQQQRVWVSLKINS